MVSSHLVDRRARLVGRDDPAVRGRRAALGERRAFAAPASLGHAVLSRGVEEQTGFAPLAARRTLRLGGAPRLVVGYELVAAVGELGRRDLWPDPELPVDRAAAQLDRFKDLYV